MMKKIFAGFLIILSYNCHAQTTENQGWLFISHTQQLNKKFDLLADVQLRSANQFNYLTTLLLRGALSYNFNKKHSVALGYAYKGDWEQQADRKTYSPENRVYEQYLYNFKYHRTELTLRARLEQRWVRDKQVDFSQRGRAFISAQIPLIADTGFTKGIYTTLQNELFLNLQHNEKVNGHIFDQNRSFLSIGYRWSKKIDTELGYQYWFQKEATDYFKRNIIQLMITTNF